MQTSTICAALVLIPAMADADPRAMTLADAVAHAEAHHPEVRAALARVAAQRAAANVPRAQWYPVFGATAQLFGATANNTTGTYVTQPYMDIPRIGATRVTSPGTMEPSASTLVAIGGTQEIFDFGRIAAQAAAEDALADVEKQRAAARELDVRYDVEEAYFAVLAAKSIDQATDAAVSRTRWHRDYAKANVASGMRPPIDLTRAEAELAKLEMAKTKSSGNITMAQAVFAAAVGVEDATLDAAPAPQERGAPAMNDALQRAAEHDPRILIAESQLDAEKKRTTAIGAELRPEFYLSATFSGRNGGAPPSSGASTLYGGWVPYIPNWDVGIVFSWPIYDGTVIARKSASRAREDMRRDEILAARQATSVAVRQASVALDVAKSAIEPLERAKTAAEANYAQAEARFKAGLGTSIELADAENVRTDADIQLALGTFESARARAALGRAMAEGQ